MRTGLLRQRRHARHRHVRPGDDELRRRVEIGHVDRQAGCPDARHDGFQRRRFQPEDGGHAEALRVGVRHQPAAQRHQPHRVVIGQRAGHHGRCVGANRQPGHGLRPGAVRHQCARRGHARRQQAELDRYGGLQAVGGVEGQHVVAQRVAGLGERLVHGAMIGQAVEHAGALRPLPGKGQQRAHAACHGSAQRTGPVAVFSSTRPPVRRRSSRAKPPWGVATWMSSRASVQSSISAASHCSSA
ncbi:hypothetical protein LMG19282_00535 [Cupriavidus campinensis]|nr:hypothetical protein LMG19282_00535 [Cupriavidus campinensis]